MVTNLALMLGRSVALPRTALADLGVAAMFHDLGFCLGPDGPMVSFDRHARAGLGVLLRQRGFHRAKVRRLLAVLTHHRDIDGESGPPPLYSRIIHIADDFDILTRPRPRAVGPAEALSRMAAHAGKGYDAALLQGFVNALGAYPTGTKLRLADGRAVVSVSAVRDSATFDRPLCRPVGGSGGAPVELSTLPPVQSILPGAGGVSE
jgi:response regulator RpfG family c-di-GMP phosphodiesterase